MCIRDSRYIVGNPPYVETKHYKAASPIMHEYLTNKYATFEGKADLSVLFIERCLSLLARNGKFGLIVQRRWFKTNYGLSLIHILFSVDKRPWMAYNQNTN